MKRIVAVLLFIGLGFTSFGQFSDTVELNQYIIDSIKDKRPDKITAIQVQKALLGLSQFLGGTGIDISNLHATATLNYNGTKIIYYNYLGHPLADSTTLPHTDIYTDGGLIQRDTLSDGVVLAAGRLDSTWLSDDGRWRYDLYMSGALDSTELAVDSTSSGSSGSTVSSGTFTSTGTAILNITSTSSAPLLYWTKIDNIVHGSVSGNIQPTATGAAHIRITLPSATSLPNGSLLGTASIAENGGTVVAAGYLFVASSTTATMRYIATYASTGTYFITLDYPE